MRFGVSSPIFVPALRPIAVVLALFVFVTRWPLALLLVALAVAVFLSPVFLLGLFLLGLLGLVAFWLPAFFNRAILGAALCVVAFFGSVFFVVAFFAVVIVCPLAPRMWSIVRACTQGIILVNIVRLPLLWAGRKPAPA